MLPEINCGDGLDNDGNGATDCDDPQCASAPECTAAPPIEDLPPPGPHWEYVGPDIPEGYLANRYDTRTDGALLPDDIATYFSGSASSAGAPSIVYPLAGAMFARNQTQVAFQWTQGDPGNTYFRIEFEREGADYSYWFFAECAQAQCVWQMPTSDWLDLAWYNNDSPVTVRIYGSAGAGSPVSVSSDLVIHFSPADVIGALYYWEAAIGRIKRATFGAPSAVPFIEPNTATNDFACSSCHSVSRDGSTIAFAVCPPEGEDVAAIRTAPTENPTAPYVAPAGAPGNPTDHLGHNVALSPDGTLAAINGIANPTDWWPPYFDIREARTGAVLSHHELVYDETGLFGNGAIGIHPEWSPSGDRIAVALAFDNGQDTDEWGCIWTSETCRSHIAVVPYLGDGQVGSPTILVEQSDMDYHFYPTWSPDGEWIAFASARLDAIGSLQKSESNPNAVLRMVRSTGGPYTCPGSDCVELTQATQYTWEEALAGNGRQSTWPKFTPFAQRYMLDQAAPDPNRPAPVFFISFNTKVNYGFLTAGETNQIWMAAVDTNLVGQGDPSYAPVWLPYQEFTDSSITPYWTQVLPCNEDPSGACTGCVQGEQCKWNAERTLCWCEGTLVE